MSTKTIKGVDVLKQEKRPTSLDFRPNISRQLIDEFPKYVLLIVARSFVMIVNRYKITLASLKGSQLTLKLKAVEPQDPIILFLYSHKNV